MHISDKRKKEFQNMIFSWWKENRRDLPWRRTHDPYIILVSEIMLQQTQVSRVLPKFHDFLIRFPDVYSLAQASTADVLKAWKGMGYNRRALYLKKTAEVVATRYDGLFPKSLAELIALPGLGNYTARALLVFAYKTDMYMVDTNIRQIIIRFFFNGHPQKEKEIEAVADQLVPKGKSWDWHQALMDYGAVHLQRVKKTGTTKSIKKPAFRDTKRFFRGKILDRLRIGPVIESELIDGLTSTYAKEKVWLLSIIQDLVRDGLAKSQNGILQLPD